MLYGIVCHYSPGKGFGFIKADKGMDVFFHVTALGECEQTPRIEPGQPVKYELIPGTEPKPPKRPRRGEEDTPQEEPVRPQAKFVELIDKIPGGIIEAPTEQQSPTHHPKARQKKPTWRR